MKATVKVENLKVFAFHGCMKEEEVIGGEYVVNATAVCRELKDSFEDKIESAVDYVVLAKIIKREMAIRSKLLETVAKRITSSCVNEIDFLDEIKLLSSKLINEPNLKTVFLKPLYGDASGVRGAALLGRDNFI